MNIREFFDSKLRLGLLVLLLIIVVGAMYLAYPKNATAGDLESYPENTITGGNCSVTINPVTPSGTKLKASASVSCSESTYHTFKVCLRRNRVLWPDKDVVCTEGNGTYKTKSLEAIGCDGQGTYWTKAIFDGITYNSPRRTLNCQK